MRVRPGFIAACSLLIIPLTYLLQDAQQRRADHRQAAENLASAVQKTKMHMAGTLSNAISDPALGYLLEQKLFHSVEQALRGRVRTGEIDQVTLFAADCSSLTRRGVGESHFPSCRTAAGAKGKFFWQETADGYPAIGVSLPVDVDGRSTIVAGVVALNVAWLELHGELAATLQRAGLELTPTKPSLAYDVPWTRHLFGVGTLFLVDPNWLAYLAGYGAAEALPVLLWALAVFCFVGIALVAGENRLEARRALEQVTMFQNWVTSSEWAAGRSAEFAVKDTWPYASQLKVCRDRLVTLLESLNFRNADTSRNLADARARLSTLSENQSSMSVQNAELNSFRSHAQQQLVVLPVVEQAVVNIHRVAERLATFLGRASRADIPMFTEVISKWNSGIDERGARRFVRSLYETENGGKSALEADLETLAAASQRISSNHTSMRELAQRLHESALGLREVAKAWRVMSQPLAEQPQVRCVEVEELAFRLIQQHALSRGATVTSHRHIPELAHHALCPSGVWIAAVFHLYLAVLEQAWSNGRSDLALLTSMRERDGQVYWILTVLETSGLTLETSLQVGADHRAMAAQLLQPYGVYLCPLPGVGGIVPSSVRWSAEDLALHEHREFIGSPAGRLEGAVGPQVLHH